MSQEAIENIYTIPFYPRLNKTAPYRRTPRAIRLLKEFIIKHTKADFVVIDEELNEFMWRKGIRNPPRKIKVRAIVETVDEEKIATVELIHEKVEVAARPELEGITIPGELEEEEEEEEEQEEEQEEDKTGVEKQPEPTKDSSKEEEQAE